MKHYKLWPISLLGLIGLLLALPGLAAAHALDQYVQSSYLTVAPDQIIVELDLSPGVLVAPQILPLLDINNDQQISEAEGQAYGELVLKNIILQVDGQPQVLTISSIEMPTILNLQAGYGTIRLFAKARLPEGLKDTHQLYYKNNYQPTGSSYQVNAFVDKGIPITLAQQERDSIQQSMSVAYTITASPAAIEAIPTVAARATIVSEIGADDPLQTLAGSPEQLGQVVSFLQQPTQSPWLILVMLGLCVLLGGLHALTPGHGKTLVAAYLIGSHGTVKHAFALGGIITFTHTISVIGVGLVVLFASQFIVPSLLVPALEIGSGLLVVMLGFRLVCTRWRARQKRNSLPHNHPHPLPDKVKFGELMTMGVSGGLIPCPEALGILLIAIGLNRLGLGLALIVAFSFGVAAVLITLGVMLVRTRLLVKRLGKPGTRWQGRLPLLSAVIVTLLGAGIVFKGLMAYSLTDGLVLLAVMAIIFVLIQLSYNFIVSIRRKPALAFAGSVAPSISPPRNKSVSNAPMAAAPLRYDAAGQVAWDEIWTDFCDLALAGGPPHRGTLLEPVVPEQVRANPADYNKVLDELERGLRLVTGLESVREAAPGWIGLICRDEAMAVWLVRAIVVENVVVRREGSLLLLPAGPDFRLEKEIKNVVTVVAKTYHYWTEHYEGSTASRSL